MKRNKHNLILIALIAMSLTFIFGVALYATQTETTGMEYAIFGAVVLVLLLGIFSVIRKLKEVGKGLVADDEMSQEIKLKAGSTAFMGSFCLWTLLLLFTRESGLSQEIVLGTGLLCMSFLFLAYLLYYNTVSIDANSN